jgi:hypothetical protein
LTPRSDVFDSGRVRAYCGELLEEMRRRLAAHAQNAAAAAAAAAAQRKQTQAPVNDELVTMTSPRGGQPAELHASSAAAVAGGSEGALVDINGAGQGECPAPGEMLLEQLFEVDRLTAEREAARRSSQATTAHSSGSAGVGMGAGDGAWGGGDARPHEPDLAAAAVPAKVCPRAHPGWGLELERWHGMEQGQGSHAPSGEEGSAGQDRSRKRRKSEKTGKQHRKEKKRRKRERKQERRRRLRRGRSGSGSGGSSTDDSEPPRDDVR